MKKLLVGDALEQRAREIGVDTQGGPITSKDAPDQKGCQEISRPVE